jgi:hypothetical protein
MGSRNGTLLWRPESGAFDARGVFFLSRMGILSSYELLEFGVGCDTISFGWNVESEGSVL